MTWVAPLHVRQEETSDQIITRPRRRGGGGWRASSAARHHARGDDLMETHLDLPLLSIICCAIYLHRILSLSMMHDTLSSDAECALEATVNQVPGVLDGTQSSVREETEIPKEPEEPEGEGVISEGPAEGEVQITEPYVDVKPLEKKEVHTSTTRFPSKLEIVSETPAKAEVDVKINEPQPRIAIKPPERNEIHTSASSTPSPLKSSSSSVGEATAASPTLSANSSSDDRNTAFSTTASTAVSTKDVDLNNWNAAVPPNLTTCMHDIISEQAAKNPDKIAITSWDGELSYRQVDEKSTSLAHHLRSLGVEVGSHVPLCFEKSMWTVVAVLGVMKAGGAFVLTDPSQPEERLKNMVHQTGANVVVTSPTQKELGQRIAPFATIITVSAELFSVLKKDSGKAELDALPPVPLSSTLYIIFTSGSTGTPKGVVIPHAAFTSGALPRAHIVGYRSHSRVLDFASYAFDVSIDCMLCTLAAGGCICVPSDASRLNDLSGAIRSMNVNMAHMTPSVARVLEPGVLESLEVLGLGGESVSASDASEWGRKTRVIIAYGPSECTVGCTINGDIEIGKAYTSIGKGVGGVTWIVDATDHDKLVLVGEVGELLIEGPIVGEGYLGEPEKSKVVFIEDPKWLLAGGRNVSGRKGRLYKTGDLVKYAPDGSGRIVFVGRGDQQVKLRGQRIELAEVEYHLRNHLPSGTSVVAEVIMPGGHGDPSLVAFVVEAFKEEREHFENAAVSISPVLERALAEMDQRLAATLPIYMIPSAYIPLPQLPSLVSAKIDRKKLRAIGAAISRQDLAKYRIAQMDSRKPETEMELRILGLWKQVLGSQLTISANDSFFGLGGDSLKAMKLVAAANSNGLVLTVASIFKHPKLTDMALQASSKKTDEELEVPAFSLLDGWDVDSARQEAAELCVLEASSIEDIYPCTPLQEGLMALSVKIEEAYVAQRVVNLPNIEIAKRLQAAFNTASIESPILRTRIVQFPGRGLMQIVVNEEAFWYSRANLEEYLTEDREKPMGLGVPLARYGLVTHEKTSRVDVVLTMHHALYDGWSMPLIADRVNRIYQGLKTQQSAPFKSFIKHLHGTNRTGSETHWRENLHGATGRTFPELPWTGYQTQADSVLERYVPLPRRSTSSTTIATAIRGAWALVSGIYSGSKDIVFGETLTGRNAPIAGVESIEGPMITTVPIRVRIDGSTTVSEYLQEIHDDAVLRMPHEHLGLQNIRRLSADAREACELRTGLVLHPSNADDERPATDDKPANGFVPAGDSEAAREALKFNTYALMLVCALDDHGFLMMASFDSKTVGVPQMQDALVHMERLVQQLCEAPNKRVGDLEYTTQMEREELRRLSLVGPHSKVDRNVLGGATATWIVDRTNAEVLLPIGGLGELLIESPTDLALHSIEFPASIDAIFAEQSAHEKILYRTGQLARYNADGSIVIVGSVEEEEKSQSNIPKPTPKARVSAVSAKQRKLLRIWSRTLQIDETEIGLTDSFFQLGGESIGAMKLVSEARLEGLELSVAQVFKARTLYEMANVVEDFQASETVAKPHTPFAALGIPDVESFLTESIKPALADPSWTVVDILPARPLQEIAVQGTVKLPRYSVRYEAFYLDAAIDRELLFRSCQELVSRNEILRTIFVEAESSCYGVVLQDLQVEINEYNVEGDVKDFCHKYCELDVQTRMPLGTPFVKFTFVQGEDGNSGLIFRISHAQYDEICLPIMLRQLSAIYQGQASPETLPFSSFVNHVVCETIPASIPYWRELLQGSSMSILRPDIPLESRNAVSFYKTVDISARSKDITIATLPTAAWALCLARRLLTYDVTFGEVVSGRNIDLPNADAVIGPCWQYVPTRVKFEDGWTALDLLNLVQRQHIASAPFESMGLKEIVEKCTNWPSSVDWFDSVVHQDVDHVENLAFLSANSKMETIYPHLEPLREWKIQAFPQGDTLTLEVVTFESWGEYAQGLLDELVEIMGMLVNSYDSKIVLN
ncbi:peptide synthetase [Lophium mytilinum]|uniref:Peptide synthetase n=1 Tax=Lophium mytilinum TaxID=390894 RepID=A0A6A6R2T3_9PEZI|nr:peptide synthetase [Lophium mytilinum]